MSQMKRIQNDIVMESAHCGLESVTTLPIANFVNAGQVQGGKTNPKEDKVRRNVIALGAIELVYPPKHTIPWSTRNFQDGPKFDTSKKYIHVNGRRHFHYDADRYNTHNVFNKKSHVQKLNEAHANNPNKYVRYPSNPLPLYEQKYQGKLVRAKYIAERDAAYESQFHWMSFSGGVVEEEDPEEEAEREYAKFWKEKGYDDAGKAESDKRVNMELSTTEKQKGYVHLPKIKGAVKYEHEVTRVSKVKDCPLSSFKEMRLQLPDVDTEAATERVEQEIAKATAPPAYIDLRRPSTSRGRTYCSGTLCISSVENVCTKSHAPKLKIVLDEMKVSSLTKTISLYGLNIDHYLPAIRSNNMNFENVCFFIDLLNLCKNNFPIELRDFRNFCRGCLPLAMNSTEISSYCVRVFNVPISIIDDFEFPEDAGYAQGGGHSFPQAEDIDCIEELTSVENKNALAPQVKEARHVSPQRSFLSEAMSLPRNISEAADKVAEAAESIPRALDGIQQSVDAGLKTVKGVKKGLDVLSVGLAATDAYIFIRYIAPSSCPTWLKWVKGFDIVLGVAKQSWPHIADKYFNVDISKLLLEARVSNLAQAGPAAGIFLSSILAWFSGGAPRGGQVAKMLEYCQRFNVISTTFHRMQFNWEFLVEWVRKLLEYVCAWTNTPALLDWFNQVSGGEVEEFAKRAVNVLNFDRDWVGSDPDVDQYIRDTRKKQKELEGLILVNGWTKEMTRFREIFKKMEEFYDLLDSRQDSVGGRLTPFCITLFGEPGVGKSQMLEDFAHLLLKDTPSGKRIYSRCNNDHYDGYTDQKAIIIDDWAMSAETDFAEMVHLVSCNPYIPPQADLSDKGKLFRGDLLLLATNSPYPNMTNSVLTPRAILRRRHLLCEVIKVKEFEAEVTPEGMYDHVIVQRYNPLCNEKIGTPMTFKEAQILTLELYKRHMNTEQAIKNAKIAREAANLPPIATEEEKEKLIRDGGSIRNIRGVYVDSKTTPGPSEQIRDKRMQVINAGVVQGGGAVALTVVKGLNILGVVGSTQMATMEFICGRHQDACLSLGLAAFHAALYFVWDSIGKPSVEEMVDNLVARVEGTPLMKKRIMGLVEPVEAEKKEVHVPVTEKHLDMIVNPDPKLTMQSMQTVMALHPHNKEVAHKMRDTYNLQELGFSCCQETQPERYNHRDNPPLKARVKRVVPEKEETPLQQVFCKPLTEGVAEATDDENALQLIGHVVTPRIMKLTVFDENDEYKGAVLGVPLGGSFILTTAHLFYDTSRGKEIREGVLRLESNDKAPDARRPVTEVPFTSESLSFLPKRDLCLVNCGHYIQPYSDITQHFVKDKDLEFLTDFSAYLVVNKSTTGWIRTTISRMMRPAVYRDGPKEYTLLAGWQYRADSQPGDCGAPLVMFNASYPRKIIGLHVSANRNTSYAYSEIVTQEDIASLLGAGVAHKIVMPEVHLEPVEEFFGEGVDYIGKVAKDEAVYQPSTTELTLSYIGHLIESGKEPAPLHNNDKRVEVKCDLLVKNFMEYAGDNPILRCNENEMVDAIVEKIKRVDPFYPKRLLSEEETVNGVDHLQRLDPYTSPGYPYVLPKWKGKYGKPTSKGKTSYMEYEHELDRWSVIPSMWKRVYEREAEAKHGRRVWSVWTACLKDEPVKIKKIKEGKPRVFTSGPMDFTMLARKYFGCFASWVQKNGMLLGIALGLDPESAQWTELFNILRSISERVLELDYTFFDKTVIAQLIMMFCRIVNAWYDDGKENAKVREVLMHEIIYTFVLLRDTIIMKKRGNPSGQALTALLNSFVSIMLLLEIFHRASGKSYAEVLENIKFFVLGDDNLCTFNVNLCSEELLKEKVVEVTRECGMTATSSTKSDDDYIKDLKDSTFLKRSFRIQGFRVYSCLEEMSLLSMLQWVTKSKYATVKQSTLVNLDTYFRYMYFYGYEKFTERRKWIIGLCDESQLYYIPPTYEKLDRIFFETGRLETMFNRPSQSRKTDEFANYNIAQKLLMMSSINEKEGGTASTTVDLNSAVTSASVADVNQADLKPSSASRVVPAPSSTGRMPNAATEKNSKGIVFSEQTEEIDVQKPSTIYTCSTKEPTWDMKTFFEIPVRMASGTWSTSQTPGTVLYDKVVPGVAFSFDRWAAVLNRYQTYKFRMRFRIEVNGTAFHAGKMVFMVRPCNAQAQYASPQTICDQVNHVALFPAYNTVATIETEWLSPQDFLTTDLTEGDNTISGYPINSCKVQMIVFNQLATGTGATTSLNWIIYGSLIDVETYIPVALTGSAQGLIDFNSVTNNVGSMENSTLPTNITGDEYDISMGLAGLDLPLDTQQPSWMVRRAISANHPVRGFPTGVRTSIYPNSQNVVAKRNFEVNEDEMNIDVIKKIWGWVGSLTSTPSQGAIQATTSQPFGTILYSRPITPVRYSKVVARATQNWDASTTPVSFLASKFGYWRGDMKFCVEIVATVFHTMKLYCGVSYGSGNIPNFASTTGAPDPTTYYGKVIEVNKSRTCFEITVPYQFPLDWCPTSRYAHNDSGNFNGATVPTTGRCPFPYITPESSIGTFFIVVLNQLAVPTGVSTGIDINVFMRGGDNLEFNTVGFGGSYFTAQAADETRIGVKSCKESINSPSNLCERVRSLKDLLKRPVLATYGYLENIVPTVAHDYNPIVTGCAYQVLDPWQLFGLTKNNLIGPYNAIYGDMRMKISVDFTATNQYLNKLMYVVYVPPQWGNQFLNTNYTEPFFGNIVASYLLAMNNQVGSAAFPYRIIDNPAASNALGVGYNGTGVNDYIYPCPGGVMTCEVIDSSSNSVELELPFYSPLRYHYNDIISPSGTVGYNNCFMQPWGTIILIQPGNAFYPITSGTVPFTASYSIFMSGGDTLRLAHWTGFSGGNIGMNYIAANSTNTTAGQITSQLANTISAYPNT